MAKIAFFECSRCGEHLSSGEPATVCPKCAGSLYVRYDMAALRKSTNRGRLPMSPANMWRYAPVLPDVVPVTLGEGFTPLLASRENPGVLVKDEGLNPTSSFKARGLALAVAMARAYGLKKLAIPSAGNAAGALAAYAAAAGLEAHVVMPKDVPQANLIECETYGAHVILVDGLIDDCAHFLRERQQAEGWFDLSTLREPFRVEGKKTIGYEIAEQMGWTLPAAVIYPTGGGTGFIGMWKAFEEMGQLGWLPGHARRPKMIAVQAAGCAPIARAWEAHESAAAAWPAPQTIAAGLRVPKPYADYLILDILRQSGGTAVAVTDHEIMHALRHWARVEGIFAAPEGAASLAAYWKLLAGGFLQPEEKVVLVNTGSGLKYIDVLAKPGKSKAAVQPAARSIGGIIQPY